MIMDTLSVATIIDQAPPNEELLRVGISTGPRHLVIIGETPSKTIIIKLTYRRLTEIAKQFDLDVIHRTSGLPFAPEPPTSSSASG